MRILARYLADGLGEDEETPALRAALLGLSGVGPETADSVLLYGLGRPVFVVDAYTRRLVVRLGLFSKDPDYDAVKALFEAALVPSVPLYNEYHALIVALAKRHCRPRPACRGCPLQRVCLSGA